MANSHIEGLDSWLRWVEDISQEVEDEVRNHVAETAYKVETDAKLLTPVDTGHLRRSIVTEMDIRGKGFVATVGTNTEYALHVEFGTYKTTAKPFLIPAYVKHKQKFERKLQEILNGVGE